VRELDHFINSDLLNREDCYGFTNQNERVVEVSIVGQKNSPYKNFPPPPTSFGLDPKFVGGICSILI